MKDSFGLAATRIDARTSNVGDPATLTEVASKPIRRKSLSPVEVTKACLERIEQLNPNPNTHTPVNIENALAQVSQAETEIQRRKWRRPLHGIPPSLGDNIDVAGVKTTDTCAVFLERIATEDAEIVLPAQGRRRVAPLKRQYARGCARISFSGHSLRSAASQVLALTNAYEQRTKWHTRRPSL